MAHYVKRMEECIKEMNDEEENIYLQICDMSCQRKGGKLDHDLPFPCNGQRRSCLHVDSIKKQQLFLYRSTKGIVKNRGKKSGSLIVWRRVFFFIPAISEIYIP